MPAGRAGLAGADAVAEGVSDSSEGVGVGQAHDGCQCSPRRADQLRRRPVSVPAQLL